MPERTAEEWREQTKEARRSARFKAAANRIKRIADGSPELTDEQRAELAAIINGNAGLMSTEQLATWLDVPSEAIECLVAAGKGPRRYVVGREVRYRPDDIPRWLAALLNGGGRE